MELEDQIANIRNILGIGDDDDPVAAIAALRADVAQVRAAIAADAPTADKAEMAKLQSELATAQRGLVTLESEMNMKIVRLEQERANERAVALVDTAIAKGHAYPVQRDMLVNMAVRDYKGTEEFIKTLPSVDMRERGVAAGAELSELEPTPTEISIAKQMGNWDESDPNKSRLNLMRVKAQGKGLRLPEEN